MDASAAVRNVGQRILVRLDAPVPWYFGEASPAPATQVDRYALNGVSLAGAALRCTQPVSGGCAGLEFVPVLTLEDGMRYELTLEDRALGSFVARGLVVATPHVVSMRATQFALTVTFDRPMLHVGDCGSASSSLQTPGTIEYVRATGPAFPPALGAYTTSSAAYRDFLSAFVSRAELSADCATVILGSGWAAPAGTFDVTVTGVKDIDGNVVVPRTLSVTIEDEGAPKLMFANLERQLADRKVIRVAYSEAMDQEYVTDRERYSLNGQPLPLDTALECELASCTWVRLTIRAGVFGYGSSNTLTIVGVRDAAGRAMEPDIVTSAPFQVY